MHHDAAHTNIENSANHDFLNAQDLLRGDMKRAQRIAKMSADLIWSHWEQVDRIARALQVHGTLSATVIRALLAR